MNRSCIETLRLLLATASAVFASGQFAMKGGTSLNLVVQEMPTNTCEYPSRSTALARSNRTWTQRPIDAACWAGWLEHLRAPLLRQKQRSPAFARLSC